jgi:MFS family permease
MSSTRTAVSPSPAASVWRLPGYPWFYLAATLGRVADEMLPIAVVLLVLDRTGSPALAGATVAASSLPTVLSGPVLGAWLDRTRYRRSALAANQLLLAAALLAMLAAAGRAPGWVVPALALAGGIGAPMLTGGITSMIPLLAPPALLPRANALEAVSFGGAAVLGPALAAAVAARSGPAAAVALEAAVALLGLLAIARMRPAPRPAGEEAGATTLSAAVRAGLAHLARTPVLRGVTLATSVAMGAQGLLPIALPLLSERLGAGRGAGGYLFAAVELGGIAGALVVGRIGAAWQPRRVVLGGIALVGLGTAGIALAPSFTAALAVAGASGLAAGPSFAALFAVRQRWSPPDLRGQIFTTGASLKIGAFALGAALAGPVVTGAGPRGAILATGVIELFAVLAGLAAGARAGASRTSPAGP